MKLTTDDVLEKIGSFGRYQIMLNIFFNLAYGFWWAFPVMVMVFIASEPGWKCKNNSTCPLTETISLGHDNYKFRCNIPREDWEFVDDFTSVVTEFDLVCDRGSLGFVSTSVIFAGFIAGSISVSSISDKFGRKLPLFVCGFFCCLFNFVSAFAPAFWVFALFRAIVGFMIGAYSIPMFVLTTELSGIRHRGTAGSLVWMGYDVSVMVLVGIAYYIRDWKHLTIATGAPGILFVAGWFFIPESVRWLLKKGRETEAREVLSNVARKNGKEMPNEALYLPKEERLGDFRDLFSSLQMAHKTLGTWLMWFAVSFIAWGISFSAPFLGGSVYVNVLILAAASLPGLPVCAFLTLRFGRRKLILASFLLAAVGAIGALLLSDKAEHDNSYLAGKIFMSMFVAKFSASVAFTLVYIYAAELFPTTLRNIAMGTATSWARVSGFASAYAPLLLTVHRFLPFAIMACLALAAAIVCMTLPETHNQPTKESLSPDPKDQTNDENRNTKDGEVETPM
ncbi:hypothetical protein OS493_027208 [Desmophyllum pertusum]|uniref:Major facilitator superfamily (MFS) profile domain-containing protein n=1 Tax=Desmophyllum pertusum TaxID=174260 RepID=A0A9W9ZLJ9_9CNID|nr:hypothetical protein OS493_027208 [Desmophyllum pertusum]